MFDTTLAPTEGPKRFLTWVSGYYRHGESILALEQRNALLYPRPTLLTISQDDMNSAIDIEPTLPGGSDSLILQQGIRHGLFTALRTAAVYVNKTPRNARGWSDVGLNYVWCDQSEWEMPYSAINFQAELEEAKKLGKATREINIIRLRGVNHFVSSPSYQPLYDPILTMEITVPLGSTCSRVARYNRMTILLGLWAVRLTTLVFTESGLTA